MCHFLVILPHSKYSIYIFNAFWIYFLMCFSGILGLCRPELRNNLKTIAHTQADWMSIFEMDQLAQEISLYQMNPKCHIFFLYYSALAPITQVKPSIPNLLQSNNQLYLLFWGSLLIHLWHKQLPCHTLIVPALNSQKI
jgi:hypothetical protein